MIRRVDRSQEVPRPEQLAGEPVRAVTARPNAESVFERTSPSTMPRPVNWLETLKDLCAEKVTPTPGPVLPAHIHTIRQAVSWNGRPVVLTNGLEEKSYGLWVLLDNPDTGAKFWHPVELPKDEKFPWQGASVVIEGNGLKILGGLDKHDQTLATAWAYDLAVGMRDGFISKLWHCDTHQWSVAWSAVTRQDLGIMRLGGIERFFLDKERGLTALETRRAQLFSRAYGHWDVAPLPDSLVGANAVCAAGEVVVGPGTRLDGVTHRYDCLGGYREPAKLPVEVGLGRLLLAKHGELIVMYYGGFTARAPNDEVYRLNLDGKAKWELIGSSPYLAGGAHLVECYGRPLCLMAAPGKPPAAFYLA